MLQYTITKSIRTKKHRRKISNFPAQFPHCLPLLGTKLCAHSTYMHKTSTLECLDGRQTIPGYMRAAQPIRKSHRRRIALAPHSSPFLPAPPPPPPLLSLSCHSTGRKSLANSRRESWWKKARTRRELARRPFRSLFLSFFLVAMHVLHTYIHATAVRIFHAPGHCMSHRLSTGRIRLFVSMCIGDVFRWEIKSARIGSSGKGLLIEDGENRSKFFFQKLFWSTSFFLGFATRGVRGEVSHFFFCNMAAVKSVFLFGQKYSFFYSKRFEWTEG